MHAGVVPLKGNKSGPQWRRRQRQRRQPYPVEHRERPSRWSNRRVVVVIAEDIEPLDLATPSR
jgi:hypothetical protein